jgi:hypothetical protein
VQVEEERREPPLQPSAGTARDREPRAGQLGRPREVEDAERHAQVDMVPGLERERGWAAVTAELDGELLRVAIRDRVERQVRYLQQQGSQLGVEVVPLALHLADLVLDVPGPLLEPFDVLAPPGDRLDLLGHPLGLRPQLVAPLDALAAPRHEVLQPGQVQGVATARQTPDGVGAHVQQGTRVMHGGPLPPHERFVRAQPSKTGGRWRPNSRSARSPSAGPHPPQWGMQDVPRATEV